MNLLILVPVVVGLAVTALLLRAYDWYSDRSQWRYLVSKQPPDPRHFDPAMIEGLPEPARRYFLFAITPGTPLFTVARIDMEGEFSLGSKEAPNYRSMKAKQILAAPYGFVWQVCLPGRVPLSGSDAGSTAFSWTRFRMFGFVPVARIGDNGDHLRSAYGRCIAEALFWTPAALLPGPGVKWQAVDADTARVTVRTGNLSQSVDIRVNAQGGPTEVFFMRWTNANAQKAYRLQPFGGAMSDFREVQGYRLPFRIEGGNLYGTEAYFPFFIANVTEIRFPTV